MAHVRPIRPERRRRRPALPRRQSAESIYLRFFAPLRSSATATSPGSPTSTTTTGWPSWRPSRGEIIGIGRYDRIDADHGRGGLQHLRRLPGPGHRLGAARAPRGDRPGGGHAPVRRRGAAAEPQDDHGLQRGRLRGQPPLRRTASSRCLRHRARPSSRRPCGLAREHRAEAREHARRCSSPARSRSSAPAGARSRSAHLMLQQHPRRRLPGAVYAVNREAKRGPGPARPTPGSATCPSRSTSPSSPCPAEQVLDVVARLRQGRRQGAAGRLGRLRRGRAEGEVRCSASCCAPAAPSRHAGGRPQLASASSTTTPTCGSTPRSPRACRRAGRLGLFAQSGALGVAVLASAARRGLGISVFASRRQPRRRLGQRPHAVLDRRRRDRRRRALPGVDGQPAQVLPDRPARSPPSSRSSW